MRRGLALAVCLVLLAPGVAAARAGTLDRVRRDGVLRCGAEPRSGVAEDRGGALGGVAVDLCRAIAASAAGPRAKIAFRLYDSARAFDAVRDGGDAVFFLSPDAIADQSLAASIIAGPPVFTVRLSLLAAQDSTARSPRDLAGSAVCFMVASDAERALDAAFRGWGRDFVHMAFQEEDEMRDAYAVGHCAAMAGEEAELSRLTAPQGVDNLASRVLPQPLATFPVIVATHAGDGAWAALVRGVAAVRTPPATAR